MRKILLSAVLLGTVAAAAPASAQYYPNRHQGYGYNHGQNINAQLANLSQRVDRLRDRRLISHREAQRLFRQIEQIDRQYDRFRRNGLSRGEYNEIQNRIQWLRGEIREERREGRDDRRDDRRYDRWDD